MRPDRDRTGRRVRRPGTAVQDHPSGWSPGRLGRPHRDDRGTGNRRPGARHPAEATAGRPGHRTPREERARARHPPSDRWAGLRPAGRGSRDAAGRGRPARRVAPRRGTAGPTATGSARKEGGPTGTSGRGLRQAYRQSGAYRGRGPAARSARRTAPSDPAAGQAARARRTGERRTGWAARPAGPVHQDLAHQDLAHQLVHPDLADRAHRDPRAADRDREHGHRGRTAGRRGCPDRTVRHPAGPARARRHRTTAGYHQAAARASGDRSRPHRASHPSPAGAGRPVGSAATSRSRARARHGAEAAAARPGADRRCHRYRRRPPQRQPHARGSRGASWDDPCCHSS